MPNLLDETSGLMAFVRTVEAGSFTAAARDLGTTPSAVSKSIARLEKKIAARLFLRSTRALTLTQEGQMFFERVAPLLRELDAGDDIIRSQVTPSGRLRISMPGELAPLLLPQLFGTFAKAYPDLQLDVGLTDRFVNLVREDYDVALRAGIPAQEDLIVRRLADLPMAVVASPAFRDTWGSPASPEALADMRFARYAMAGAIQHRSPGRWHGLRSRGTDRLRYRHGLDPCRPLRAWRGVSFAMPRGGRTAGRHACRSRATVRISKTSPQRIACFRPDRTAAGKTILRLYGWRGQNPRQSVDFRRAPTRRMVRRPGGRRMKAPCNPRPGVRRNRARNCRKWFQAGCSQCGRSRRSFSFSFQAGGTQR
jgi:DNA-binding transcriptional LysR family regulator